jgi:hypothetical protein
MEDKTAVLDEVDGSEVVLDQDDDIDKEINSESDSDDNEEETTSDDSQVHTDDAEEDSDSDEVTVSIGEESPPQDTQDDIRAPEWVRELRKTNRDLKRQNRELQDRVKVFSGADQKPVELGKKPTLEDSDYDADKFERELESWFDRKRKFDDVESQKKLQAQQETEAWNSRLKTYEEKKASLKARDFDDAEELVTDTLSKTQLGMIVQGSDDPAIVIYAIGKNQNKLKELASITDPVRFAFAVAKMETQLKVTTKKRPPSPEKTVASSGGASSSSSDSVLNRLRDEAAKTGDLTKVIAYKNKLKLKGKG